MIPFDQIAARLQALGKNRQWLAAVSGRTILSLDSALAPAAAKSKRSKLLQRALTDAIEREETRQANAETSFRNQNLVVEASPEEFRAWNAAAMAAGMLIEEWALEGLNRMALRAKSQPEQPPAKTA